MMNTMRIKEILQAGEIDNTLQALYGSEALEEQRKRYLAAVVAFEETFGEGREAEIYSAPGRTEVGGNHTDHQHGNVLAASITADAIAVASPRTDDMIRVLSEGYPMIEISLSTGEPVPEEEGTTAALIRGVAAGLKQKGLRVGGMDAYVTSDVLGGSGLSSSAAFETLVGDILWGMFNEAELDAVEIAKIGQYAENVYFGKPCGLMDQMACSVGALCQIDFLDPENPVIRKVELDLDRMGYSLCITDTKGSHADLTADYAAVPAEMKAAAAVFGKEYLRDVPKEELMSGLGRVREACGDRAALRALHFVEENGRAVAEAEAIKKGDFAGFLQVFRASAKSSFCYLQNVYTNHDVTHQNVSIALAVSDMVLGDDGAARVHGGGFAGTIQAFVRKDAVERYRAAMDGLFGEGACHVMGIRPVGGVRVI